MRRAAILRASFAALSIFILGLAIHIARPPDLGRLSEVSKVVRGSQGGILELRLTTEGYWREPVRLEQIDDDLVAMLVAYEDQRFWDHSGVDFYAIARATLSSARSGRVTSGASTLTMQTVRLINPDLGRRTLWIKARQIIEAIRLEAHMNKEEILEAYFTLAPYGGNIEGIVAASHAWFEKSPAQLTMTEIALLVAIPQSPEARRPDRFAIRAQAAKDRVLETVQARLSISDADLAEYMAEGLPNRRYFPSSRAAHLADRFDTTAFAYYSTLNEEWQENVSSIVQTYVGQLPLPINGAAMVIERRTGHVRAYVGSGGYLSQQRKGGVNFLQAVRSPGSTIKPFIYAKALQLGLIAPNEVFQDVPLQIEGYAPGNFDANFTGAVTLADALTQSLNIPAVQTLNAIGATAFENTISTFLGRVSSEAAGLSLAVGGYYMTAEELAELYLEFANPGQVGGLVFFEDQHQLRRPFFLEPRSANTVQNLLLQQETDGSQVLFKTGTSHQRQDAWTVALTENHVVLVWLGTPDVQATEVLTGRSSAYPLVQQIIESLGLEPPSAREDALTAPSAALALRLECQDLIQFPENGEWIRSDDLSLSVYGTAGAMWYLNSEPTSLEAGRLLLRHPGVQRITARVDDCHETVEVFVEVKN